MRVLSSPTAEIGFNFGLLPGVFAGSFLDAWIGRDLKIEGFTDGYSMTRYITGAMLMGFGSMLAGGCAVSAGLTDRWLDSKGVAAPVASSLLQPAVAP
jgi:hypothetical protein